MFTKLTAKNSLRRVITASFRPQAAFTPSSSTFSIATAFPKPAIQQQALLGLVPQLRQFSAQMEEAEAAETSARPTTPSPFATLFRSCHLGFHSMRCVKSGTLPRYSLFCWYCEILLVSVHILIDMR